MLKIDENKMNKWESDNWYFLCILVMLIRAEVISDDDASSMYTRHRKVKTLERRQTWMKDCNG